MKEEISKKTMSASAPGGVPHFDDEQTLLAARQVIPLKKIDAKFRRRRRWFLGGAFAVAMLLGAASALLTSYLKLRHANNAATEVPQVELGATATTEIAIREPEAAPSLSEEEAAAGPKEPVTRRRTQPEPGRIPSQTPRATEDEELERIRDAVLHDEWQERRMRRVMRRERRRAERNNRDLSNLDEIFEGRRRRLDP